MIEQVISALKMLAEKQREERSKIMFPTAMDIIGVRAPNIHKVVNECWAEIKMQAPENQLLFATKLVETNIFECNQVAFLLLWKNKKVLALIDLRELEILGRNLDNWATVDTFSVLISGWAWRENQISDGNVLNWLKSDNRWWRRTAVVSTVALNLKARGGTGDAKRTLLICEKVIHDRDDMLVKALSWALRELSKSNKPAVEEFMAKHNHNLAGRVKREVYTKLETGRKNG